MFVQSSLLPFLMEHLMKNVELLFHVLQIGEIYLQPLKPWIQGIFQHTSTVLTQHTSSVLL